MALVVGDRQLPIEDDGPQASGKTAKFYLEPKRLLRFNPFIKQLILLEIDPPAPD